MLLPALIVCTMHVCLYYDQVRINAALALSAGVQYLSSEAAIFVGVWDAVLIAMNTSDQQVDFSEYKHASTFKTQVYTYPCICSVSGIAKL